MFEKQILFNNIQISELISDLAQQIQSAHTNLNQLAFVGILSEGYPIAARLSKIIKEKTNTTIPVGRLDIALYRDDLHSRKNFVSVRGSHVPFDINNKIIILIDDVLFQARTMRAALNGIMDFGSPSKIELAVLIDRGHRELPIFANYIGKKLETSKSDYVQVNISEKESSSDSIIYKK